MPIFSGSALGLGSLIGAVGGAVSGLSGKTTSKRLRVGDADIFERRLREAQSGFFDQLRSLTEAGAGRADVASATEAQRDVASRLQTMAQSGGLPTDDDVKKATEFAHTAFAAQRTRLSQAFDDQRVAAARAAAQLGRETNDPILQAKLAQEQTRQQDVLSARQGAAAQEFALALPGQRLGFAAQRADVLGGLANQAFANRQNLLSIGNQLAQQERKFRIQTGTKEKTQEGSLAQGIMGGLTGLASGFNMGANMEATSRLLSDKSASPLEITRALRGQQTQQGMPSFIAQGLPPAPLQRPEVHGPPRPAFQPIQLGMLGGGFSPLNVGPTGPMPGVNLRQAPPMFLDHTNRGFGGRGF